VQGSQLLRRRLATALGSYGSVVLGVLASVAAARELGRHDFGLFAIVLAAASFFQVLLDLTVEEAMVKFGFRYLTAEDWGKLRRLYRRALAYKGIGALVAGAALCCLAPLAHAVFGVHGLLVPMLLAGLLPLAQAPEPVAGAALVLRERYDHRAFLLFVAMALRLTGLAVGAHYGLTETVAGLVAAQCAAAAIVGIAGIRAFRAFPHGADEELAGDRREIVRFVMQSSIATGIISLRGTLGPLLLGVVTTPAQVGYFKIGQAPMTGLAALTAPARLILLTEQTRDWERGAADTVFAGVRRFSFGAALLMVAAVPPLLWLMPDLIDLVFGKAYHPAGNPARLMLLAGALQLILSWTKSLPVSIGRPGLRIVTHGLEALVFIPLVVAFGSLWNATGAALAVVISTFAFAALWIVLVVRLRRESLLIEPAVSR
jgi:O-antigen/teichoic acid export membrane protein